MLTAVAVTKGWCHWEYQEALHPTFPMCYYSLGPWKSKHNIPVRHLRLCLPLWLESWLWHWWMGLINLGPHQHLPRVFSLLPCLRAICVDLISLWGSLLYLTQSLVLWKEGAINRFQILPDPGNWLPGGEKGWGEVGVWDQGCVDTCLS
jgi:hypothetical protein